MLSLLLLYSLVSFLSLLIFYLLGGIVFNILKIGIQEPYLKLFAHLLCGIIVSVFFYSIAITQGNTVFMGLLIPGLFLFSLYNSKQKVSERLLKTLTLPPTIIILCSIVLLAVCGYNLFFIWDTVHHNLVPPETDMVFYSRVSAYLNFSGIESSYLDYFNANNPRPYHFFELWITALTGRFSGLNTVVLQQVSVGSILFLILFSGGLAFVSSVKKITIFDIVICLFLPFLHGIRIQALPDIFFHRHDFFFFTNPLNHAKLYIVSILFLASGILFLKQRTDMALLILLVGCIANISLITSFPMVIILMTLVTRMENKIKVIAASVLTILFVYLFYSINKTTELMIESPPLMYMIKSTFTSFGNFKIVFDNTAKSITEIVLIFFPVFIALYLIWKRDKAITKLLIPMTLLVIIIFFVSDAIWSVFLIKSDSIQLFTNIGIPIVNTYFFIVLIILIRQLNSWKLNMIYLAIIIWGVLCLQDTNQNLQRLKNQALNRYSQEYLQAVKDELKTLNNQGGHLCKFTGTYDMFAIKFMVYSYKPYLVMMKNNLNITLLQSTEGIGLSDDSLYRSQQYPFLKLLFFNRYLESQKLNNKFLSEEQSRIDFIKENNLEFIIADKGVEIDSSIQSMTESAITDKVSGERFIVLKR